MLLLKFDSQANLLLFSIYTNNLYTKFFVNKYLSPKNEYNFKLCIVQRRYILYFSGKKLSLNLLTFDYINNHE